MLLRTEQLSKQFDGLLAISNVDFELAEGEVRGLIGPNGSGKSTFFNLVSGIYKPDTGRVWFQDEEITGLESHLTAERGIARTFQLLRMFTEMTVLENLMVGHHVHGNYNALAATLALRRVRDEDARVRAEMMDLLSTIGLVDYAELSRLGAFDRTTPTASTWSCDGDAPETPAAGRASGGAEPTQRGQYDADRDGTQGPLRTDGGHH